MENQNTTDNNIQNSESGIAMIYPPPETKKIIDEAATLVAEYGNSVESQMQNDEKFSFIKKSDPYYMYYQAKITEVQKLLKEKIEKWKLEQSQKNNSELENNNQNEFLGKKRNNDNNDIEKETKELLENALKSKIEKIKKDNNKLLKNYDNIPMPKPDMFTVLQPNISGTELDIIKITAQFAAKNGQKFLTDLIKREKENPQFDFMKPQHTLFGYFTFLVGCYAKILNNKNEILPKIINYATDIDEILKKTHQNYLYESKINKISRGKKFSQEDLLTEEEKSKLKQIDWYDFVVVETINFDSDFEDEDNEKKNTEIFKSENLYTENQNNENTNIINSEISTNEINNNEINENNNNNDEQEIIYVNGKKIIKNYVREKKVLTLKTGDIENNNITCPLCKLSISSAKIEEHLKIELLDPRWKKIQEEINKNQEQTNLADTMDFLSYLEDFSKSRPDLFGDISDITLLEKTRKEEKNKNINHEVWDGVDEHMNRTTANILMFKTQNKRHIDQSKKYTKKNNID